MLQPRKIVYFWMNSIILPLSIQYGEEKQWERRERDKEKNSASHYPIWWRKAMGKKGKRQGKKKIVYCNQLNQSARLHPLSNMVKKSNGKERKKTRKKKSYRLLIFDSCCPTLIIPWFIGIFLVRIQKIRSTLWIQIFQKAKQW